MFAPGQRPDARAIQKLAEQTKHPGTFAISHWPAEGEGWLELLAMGLTFDLAGLAPSELLPLPAVAHFFGVDRSLAAAELEALTLRPGPHLVAGANLLPVIRIMAGLGATLAQLPGVRAIGWNPARSWMAPASFASAVEGWLGGGVFPALGLTALVPTPDGGCESEGLSLFTGYELRIEPIPNKPTVEAAKLAMRIIHQLIERGGEMVPELRGLGGEPLKANFSSDRKFLHIRIDGGSLTQ
jgi:hypothetical protein